MDLQLFDARRPPVSGIVLGLAALLFLGPCDSDERADTGVLRFVQVEGGCWELQTEGEAFEVLNLEEDFPEFAEDGLRVRFEGEIREDVVTICQLGPNLELTELERLE